MREPVEDLTLDSCPYPRWIGGDNLECGVSVLLLVTRKPNYRVGTIAAFVRNPIAAMYFVPNRDWMISALFVPLNQISTCRWVLLARRSFSMVDSRWGLV